MEEGERKLCLVELTLELTEKIPLQVQMQLLEKMEGGEALAVEAVVGEQVAQSTANILLLPSQQEMEATAELVVMEAEAAEVVWEGALFLKALIQEREVLVELEVLEEEAEVAEVLDILAKEIGVVMAQQEVMAEVEGVAVFLVGVSLAVEVLVAAALVALD